ncbi:MAG: FAD-containing oxidoreductase, partial [Nitrospirae bacterium]
VRVVVGAAITAVEATAGAKAIRLDRDGPGARIEVDEILVGVGRAPNVEGLDLEAAGVAYDTRRGVYVDDRLRTSNRRIYAAGDICSAAKFTHTAEAQARIVLANALFRGRARASRLVVPWCIYTDPEVAHVGLDEAEARRRGLAVRTFTQPLAEVDRAVLDGEAEGYARIVAAARGDRILGATVVARHAGEMISEITALMVAGKGLATLSKTIHPYPTQAEVWRRLGDAYLRSRLTPRAGRWIRRWLAWTR